MSAILANSSASASGGMGMFGTKIVVFQCRKLQLQT